jgi:thioredoxin 1
LTKPDNGPDAHKHFGCLGDETNIIFWGGIAMAKLATVNDENFNEEILRHEKPSAVLFKTEGCPYCRAMEPVMEQVAEEFTDQLKIVIIDALENQEKSDEYGIQAVPQLLFFKDGMIVDSILGARPKDEVVNKIRSVLEEVATVRG